MSEDNGDSMDDLNVSMFYDAEFTSFSFSEFKDMRQKGELIDCKIAVRNRCISAHRLILAARIPLFRKFLVTSARGVLKLEEDINPDVFESLIDYAYTGTVKITTDNVKVLLLASGYLQIREVYEACWVFLEVRLCLDNVWQTRTIADDHRRLTLVEACDDYIRENFEAFSKTESLKSLPFAYFKEVIGKIDIERRTEENMFEAVILWVRVFSSRRKEMLPELLQMLDGSRLNPKYLIDRVGKETLVRECLLCKDWLEEAKNYHLYRFLSGQRQVFRDVMPRPISKQPSPPMSHASGPDSGIYAVCDSESKLSVKLLDSRKRKWIALCQRNLACVYYAFALNEKMYIFCKSSTEILDVKTLEWHTIETDHGSLYSAGLVSFNDVVYSFGGGRDLAYTVRCFDLLLNEWNTKAEMRKPRMFSGVTELNRSIYVTGGTFSTSSSDRFTAGDIYSDAEQYNTQTETWEEIQPMLHCRYDHGCTSLSGKIYVCGGFSSAYLNTGEMYDPSTKNWSCISSMNVPKLLYCLTSYDGKLYTLRQGLDNNASAIDTYIYEPTGNSWTSGVPILDHHGCDGAFLICAKTPAETEVKDDEEGPELTSWESQ